MGEQRQIPSIPQTSSRKASDTRYQVGRIRRRLFLAHANLVPLQQVYDDGSYSTPLSSYSIYSPTYYLSQKLIKRTVFPDHLALLTKRQDDLLAQLGELAKAGFTKAEEEWEKSVVAWGNYHTSHWLYLPLFLILILFWLRVCR